MSYALSDTSESRKEMTDIGPEMFPDVDIKGHITRSVAAHMHAKDDKKDIIDEDEGDISEESEGDISKEEEEGPNEENE